MAIQQGLNTIQSQWESFAKISVPKGAGAVEIRQRELCFYAGAEGMRRIIEHIGGDEVTEDAGVAILESVEAELLDFADAVILEARGMVIE